MLSREMPFQRLVALQAWFLGLAAAVQALPASGIDLRLLRVRKLATNAYFPDITRYRDQWLISYRKANHHSDQSLGKIVVLLSPDGGESWRAASELAMPDADLRDPRFCRLASGRLMLNGGIGARAGKGPWQGKRRGSFVAFSDDGVAWTEPLETLDGRDEWLWRCTLHEDGYAYGVVKEQGQGRYANLPAQQYSRLVRTKDGLHYESIVGLRQGNVPNEATIRFAEDKTAYLIHRMADTALLGVSDPPYVNWTWHDLDRKIGGPNLIQLTGGQWLVGGRRHAADKRTMQLGRLDTSAGRYEPLLDLPSGGDCSYPGFLLDRDVLNVVYYSSHEGETALYLAELSVNR